MTEVVEMNNATTSAETRPAPDNFTCAIERPQGPQESSVIAVYGPDHEAEAAIQSEDPSGVEANA